MKKLLLSTTLITILMAASVFAADLPSSKSATIDALTPTWTGFYAGLNAGYGFGTSNNAHNIGWSNSNFWDAYVRVDTTAVAVANSGPGRNINQGGFFGGGQVGYNYQFSRGFLVGLETDIQGAGVRGTGSADGYGPTEDNVSYNNNISIQAGIDWMGTLRGRFGYLLSPNLQIYGTGGLAYGGVFLNTSSAGLINQANSTVINFLALNTSNTSQKLLAGWTAGAGAEWMVSQNWSIKGEALYYDLGGLSVTNLQYVGFMPSLFANRNPVGGNTILTSYQGIIARTGLNYHFNLNNITAHNSGFYQHHIEMKNLNTIEIFPTGFYAGINNGYGFGITSNATNTGWANSEYWRLVGGPTATMAMVAANSAPGRNINQGGFIGGGQVGYDHKFLNTIIVGLETDIQGAGVRGTGSADGFGPTGNNASYNNNISIQAGMDWIGTARGRLGYLITPSSFIYGTGGFAYGGAFLNTSSPGLVAQTNDSIVNYLILTTKNTSQKLLAGWTAGAGAEWMVSQNWSIKGEALYYDLGELSVTNTQYSGNPIFSGFNPVGGFTTRADFQGVIARVGVNYHFNFGRLLN